MIDVLAYPSPEAEGTTVVYAVGDVHGRLDLLEAMDRLIADDIAATRPERPTVCYLGDYIDRGPHSAQVISHLAARSVARPVEPPRRPSREDAAPAWVFLKGNHEDRMLDFLAAPAAHGPAWMEFGGIEALASYGVTTGREPVDGGWDRLRDELQERLPTAHLDFLRRLRLAFVWRSYVFVHAGLDPERPLHAQDPRDLMWIKEPFLSSTREWSHRVVHGHVVGPEPVFRDNRIGIDTGASRFGRLTCLVVSDGPPRVLQAHQV
jgi:serine/threonine protein phosphatase 1